MRVLHVHSGNLFGGVERILETLASSWRLHAGMEPAFALNFDGRLASRLRDCAVSLDLIGPIRARRPWGVRRVRQALVEVIHRRQPDVVVLHSSWSQALLGPAIRRTALPLVRWLHAPEPGIAVLEWAAARVRLNLVICNSRYTCHASDGRFPEARRTVCYAPVSVPAVRSDRAAVRAACGTRADAIVVAVAARMESWKGQAVLIDALTALAADPRWHGWVIGGAQREGERAYLEGLKAQARRGGIGDRVTFLGDREDVDRLLAAADVYCQPNAGAEPFGLSFVEALGAGLPVVATRLGALPEIVDETCGILVERGEAGLVAAALLHVMNPATRLTLAKGARERARSFGDVPSRLAALAGALELVTQPRNTVSRTVLQ